MNEKVGTVECCVYAHTSAVFLEFVHEEHFVTIELTTEPQGTFAVHTISVESVNPGSAYQGFARIAQCQTERRLPLPVTVADKVIAFMAVSNSFGADGVRLSKGGVSPIDELHRIVSEDLEVFYSRSS
jgi:hypothetical protein